MSTNEKQVCELCDGSNNVELTPWRSTVIYMCRNCQDGFKAKDYKERLRGRWYALGFVLGILIVIGLCFAFGFIIGRITVG